MSAFYDDGTGLCYWCPQPAGYELYGIPLCDQHYGEEETRLMQDAGFPF